MPGLSIKRGDRIIFALPHTIPVRGVVLETNCSVSIDDLVNVTAQLSILNAMMNSHEPLQCNACRVLLAGSEQSILVSVDDLTLTVTQEIVDVQRAPQAR